MTLANLLETLPTQKLGQSRSDTLTSEAAINLEEFERGYQAGWDDATKAYNEKMSAFSDEFKEHLLDLGFTYAAAKSEILSGLEPLLKQISTALLPEIAKEGFAQYLLDQLRDIAQDAAHPTVLLSLNPDQVGPIQHILEHDLGFPFEISSDPLIQMNVARLEFQNREMEIDLSDCIANIEATITSLCSSNKKASYG